MKEKRENMTIEKEIKISNEDRRNRGPGVTLVKEQLLIFIMAYAHKARTRSRQTPLSWALLAAVPHVNPAAFSSSSIVRRHVVSACLFLCFLLAPRLALFFFCGRPLFIMYA